MRIASLVNIFSILFCGLLLWSCEDIDPAVNVASYITIDKITVKNDPAFGSNSSDITDAWVYVDSEFLGVFPLPAKIPVLKTGSHTLTVHGGIKVNGIGATRSRYDFYLPYIKDTILVAGKDIHIPDPVVSYSPATKIPWSEPFENGVSIDTANYSSTYIKLVTDSAKYPENGNQSSGAIFLDDAHTSFFGKSHNTFSLPYYGSSVFVELNFKSDNEFTLGVISVIDGAEYGNPFITINPSNGAWKKIFIEITPEIRKNPGASGYRIYFDALKNNGKSTASIYLDNIKLIHQ